MGQNTAMDALIGLQLAWDAYPTDVLPLDNKPPDVASGTGTAPGFDFVKDYGYYGKKGGDHNPGQPTAFSISGGAFATYVNESTKQLVFAFKGSTLWHDFTSDLLHNGDNVIDPTVDYANTVLELIKKGTGRYAPYKDYTITAVGHSLGGAEAQTFAAVNNLNAYVYDSLPISADYIYRPKGSAGTGIPIGNLISAYKAQTISTIYQGEIATWYYNKVQEAIGLAADLNLDKSPTVIPSDVDKKAKKAGFLFTPLGFLLVKGLAHSLEYIKKATEQGWTTDSNGRFEPLAGTTTASASTTTSTAPGGSTIVIGGQSVTTTINGTTGSIRGSNGLTGTLTVLSNGLTTTWQNGSNQHGSDAHNADGSGTGTTTYADGAYANYINDGQGNFTVDYFAKDGTPNGSSFVHSDGTSGVVSPVLTGRTRDFNAQTVPPVNLDTLANPDGSYQTRATNADDVITTSNYDVNGKLVSQSYANGSGVNYDMKDESRPTLRDDKHGNKSTYYSDSKGNLTHDRWTDAQGVTGTDRFNASGFVEGRQVNVDHSVDTFTLYQTGAPSADYRISDADTIIISSDYDRTKDHHDSNGILLSDEWKLAGDSESGNDIFNADGSANGTTFRAGKAISTMTLDTQGNIKMDNLDSQGTVASEDWWHRDGTHGFISYQNGSANVTYTYALNGLVEIDEIAADGSTISQSSVLAGAFVNPDGSNFSKIINTDNTYDVVYSNNYGNVSTIQFSAGNQPLTTNHEGDNRAPTVGYSGTTTGGQSWTSASNPYTLQIVNSNGDVFTYYTSSTGSSTGYTYTNPNGRHGFDNTFADGSHEGAKYDGNGSNITYTDDGKGNIVNNKFNISGIATGNIWVNADQSSGQVAFVSGGSSNSSFYAADNSQIDRQDDGKGTSGESDYASDGFDLKNTWIYADGHSQSDIFSRDNSVASLINGADNTSRTVRYDTNHNYYTVGDFDKKGKLTAVGWSSGNADVTTKTATDTNGVSTTTQNNSYDNSKWVKTQQVNGAYSISSADGQGNYVNNNYNDNKKLTDTDWRSANGTSGTRVIGADNSWVYTVDSGSGNSTASNYSASGRLISLAWSQGNTDVTSTTSTNGGSQAASSANASSMSATGVAGGHVTTRSNRADNTCIVQVANDDGSGSTTFEDGYGNNTTNDYNAQGQLIADSWSVYDGTSGNKTYNANGTPGTSYTDDGRGVTVSSGFDASGNLLGTTTVTTTADVNNPLAITATTTFTGSAITLGITKSVAINSADGYTVTTNNSNASGNVVSHSVAATDVAGNATTDSYNQQGVLASVAWNARNQYVSNTTKTSDSGAQVTFSSNSSDQSSVSKTVNTDGSRTIVWNDGHGASTTNNYNASGRLVSDSWIKDDGSSGSDDYGANGAAAGSATTMPAKDANHPQVETAESTGMFVRQGVATIVSSLTAVGFTPSIANHFSRGSVFGGSSITIDGSSCGGIYVPGRAQTKNTTQADKHSVVSSTDASGNFIAIDRNDSGAITAEIWAGANGWPVTHADDVSGLNLSGWYDGKGDSAAEIYDATGWLTGGRWKNFDRSHVIATYKLPSQLGSANSLSLLFDGNQISFDRLNNDPKIQSYSQSPIDVANSFDYSSCKALASHASGGKLATASQVNALVSAMASFAPPASGQLSMGSFEQTAFRPTLAVNWH